jgi:ribosomal protein S18 acetylase RimI-like enzyme
MTKLSTAIRPANRGDMSGLGAAFTLLQDEGLGLMPDCFIAENNLGAIVGTITCDFVTFDDYARPSATVCTLHVEPSHRRRGIGRRLLAAADAWAEERGETKINIIVRSANVAAVKLYEAVGYTYFADIGDLFLLKKELRPASEVAA